MRGSLAEALGVTFADVMVKGKSNERMGWIGRGEGLAVIAVASLTAAGSRNRSRDLPTIGRPGSPGMSLNRGWRVIQGLLWLPRLPNAERGYQQVTDFPRESQYGHAMLYLGQ